MKVGGKRTLKIPSSLEYGSRGAGDLIPFNSTLIFEIEIIDAKPPGYKKYSQKIYKITNIKNLSLLILEL